VDDATDNCPPAANPDQATATRTAWATFDTDADADGIEDKPTSAPSSQPDQPTATKTGSATPATTTTTATAPDHGSVAPPDEVARWRPDRMVAARREGVVEGCFHVGQ
jgi:hypothetical protein